MSLLFAGVNIPSERALIPSAIKIKSNPIVSFKNVSKIAAIINETIGWNARSHSVRDIPW